MAPRLATLPLAFWPAHLPACHLPACLEGDAEEALAKKPTGARRQSRDQRHEHLGGRAAAARATVVTPRPGSLRRPICRCSRAPVSRCLGRGPWPRLLEQRFDPRPRPARALAAPAA